MKLTKQKVWIVNLLLLVAIVVTSCYLLHINVRFEEEVGEYQYHSLVRLETRLDELIQITENGNQEEYHRMKRLINSTINLYLFRSSHMGSLAHLVDGIIDVEMNEPIIDNLGNLEKMHKGLNALLTELDGQADTNRTTYEFFLNEDKRDVFYEEYLTLEERWGNTEETYFDISAVLKDMQESSFISFSIKENDRGDYSHRSYPEIRDKDVIESVIGTINRYEYTYLSDKPISHYSMGALYIKSVRREIIVVLSEEETAKLHMRLIEENETYYELETDIDLYHELEQLVLDNSLRLAEKMANEFGVALENGNKEALKALAFDSEESIDHWENFEISDVTVFPIENQDTLFRVEFKVDQVGSTPFQIGENKYVVEVNFASFDTNYSVSNFIEQEKYEWIDDNRSLELCNLLRKWITLTEVYLFDTPAGIDKEKLLEFLISTAVDQHQNVTGEKKYEFIQDEIDNIAQEYFGLESMVLTESKFYDNQIERYVLRGRGPAELYFFITEIDHDELNDTDSLLVEYYSDGLKTDTLRTVKYIFYDNGNGSYRFISAVQL